MSNDTDSDYTLNGLSSSSSEESLSILTSTDTTLIEDDESICTMTSESTVSSIYLFDSFHEEDVFDIIQDIHQQFDDYYEKNIIKLSSPKFYTDMIQTVIDTLYEEWECTIEVEIEDYSQIRDFVEQTYDDYEMYNTKIPKRSISYPSQCQPTGDLSLNNVLVDQIKQLQGLPQPVQRTPEWYEFRNGLLSASSLWKAIGSQSQINSIIYEKCKAFNEEPVYQQYGTGTAMHWGVKYEPVTVQIYEDLYQTEVGEFGCIRHPTYSFIGASPDGINIKPNSVKFGSMLEIKNIVNREITGIPKEDYWIQTQIQMETCDLDNCDFVETRIKEYEKEDEFYANTTNSDYRGIVLYFIKNDFSQNAEPIYHYMPLNVPLDRENITKWIDADIELARQDELVLFNTIYWYLDEFSCVLIERNRPWFSSAIVKFKEVWDIIEKEKVDGYEHRSPKKKVNKLGASNVDTRVHTIPRQTKICLVKLDSN